MRTSTFGLALALALVLQASGAFAINCDQVKKAAAAGRSEDDIAETMIVDPAEVKKCLAGDAKEPDKDKPKEAAPAPAEEKKN